MAQSNRIEMQLCEALTAGRQLKSLTPSDNEQAPSANETIAITAARGANTNIGQVEPAETPRTSSGGRTTELQLRNRLVKATEAKNPKKPFKIGKFCFIRGVNPKHRNGDKVTERRFPNSWVKVEQPEEATKIGRFRFTPSGRLRSRNGNKVTECRFPAKWEKVLLIE